MAKGKAESSIVFIVVIISYNTITVIECMRVVLQKAVTNMSHKTSRFLFFCSLLMGFAACSRFAPAVPTPVQSPLVATSPMVSQTTPLPISTQKASQTPARRPSLTPSATAEVFSCLPTVGEAGEALSPLRILYVNENRVWLWDEISRQKTALELPEDAVAPHLSPDGRYIAFFSDGQVVSHPEKPLVGIPLHIFDRLENSVLEIGAFSTRATHERYPQASRVYLQLVWQTTAERDAVEALEVQVIAEPWGLGAGNTVGERFRVSLPDGRVDPMALNDSPLPQGDEGTFRHNLPVISPDRRFEVLPHPQGVLLRDRQNGEERVVALEPACPDPEVCYLTGDRMITWRLDSTGFYTFAAKNAYFDQRANTTVYFVEVDTPIKVEVLAVLHANPATFSMSPDRRFLPFWNQPDVDNAPQKTYNWVTLTLLDLDENVQRRYTAAWSLRLSSWNPDSRRFLLTYSTFGGPNPIVNRLALGDICRPPLELVSVPDQVIMGTHWLDTERFLMWTAPKSGISDRYTAGMYFYDLRSGDKPIEIDGLVQNYDQPYGTRIEFVPLK